MTTQHYQALLAIKGSTHGTEFTVGDLSDQLQIAPHSSVGLINRLEKQGLVKRKPSTSDKRKVFVMLTLKGKSVLDKLMIVHREQLTELAPMLNRVVSQIQAV